MAAVRKIPGMSSVLSPAMLHINRREAIIICSPIRLPCIS
jgi:hypothetical protein